MKKSKPETHQVGNGKVSCQSVIHQDYLSNNFEKYSLKFKFQNLHPKFLLHGIETERTLADFASFTSTKLILDQCDGLMLARITKLCSIQISDRSAASSRDRKSVV